MTLFPRQWIASTLLLGLVPSPVAAQADPATSPPDNRPRLEWHLDFTFAGVRDESLRGAMGREQQIKPTAAVVTIHARISPLLTMHLETNPVGDDRAPRPYVPLESDRRTYFFPNQPDVLGGRGVSSDPEGLYKVDAYKHSGLDPLLQMYMLRVGYADFHSRTHTVGARFGRFYVRQGLALDELTWFTAKDLTTIQLVNAQADNGVSLYWTPKILQLSTQVITGNGSPYQDYGYFDFTDGAEDKNSSVGVVADGRATLLHGHVMLGGSYRRNYLNSQVEDSASLQLSKHNDDARMVYGRLSLNRVQIYGEWATYVVGLTRRSAALQRGPPVASPVHRSGFYGGTKIGPVHLPKTQVSGVVEYETMSRNDALVALAAANNMFGVRLGATIKATNAKLIANWGSHVSGFAFVRLMSNPFPQLSAISPISGPNANRGANHTKIGLGMRVRF